MILTYMYFQKQQFKKELSAYTWSLHTVSFLCGPFKKKDIYNTQYKSFIVNI